MKKTLKSSKGFTLLELLVAIVIAALLIGLGATAYNNIIGDSSPRAAAMGVSKDMQEIFKMSHKSLADTTSEPANLAVLTTAGLLTAIPTPPAEASAASYTWDAATYTGWATGSADTVIKLTGVSEGACKKFNELFAGAAAGAAPPGAVDTTKKQQCFGAGPTYTALTPIFVH